MADTKEKVIAILADHTGQDVGSITESTDLMNDLGLDSLDFAEIVMRFEDDFSVSIGEQDAQNLKTVGDIVKHIDKAGGAA